MTEKRAQKTKKDGDGNYEEDLDTYFVDRLRFLNQKDHTTQHLKQRFKVLPRPPPSLGLTSGLCGRRRGMGASRPRRR
jgi:hypothetical protein